MEFHGWWTQLLKDSCYYSEKIELHNFYDVLKLMTDEQIKSVFKKFRNLSEETILYDMKRIHKIDPFHKDVLNKLHIRNPLFLPELFLEEGREL